MTRNASSDSWRSSLDKTSNPIPMVAKGRGGSRGASPGERERVLINVNTLYREFGSAAVIDDVMAVFAQMGDIWLMAER